MRNLACLVVLGTLWLSSSARAADEWPADQRVLERAVFLAGPLFAHLPIVLTSVLPSMVSPGAEAWTIYLETGQGDKIFVYTGSAIFQCASTSRSNGWQCELKLASLIVHEAWHLRNGPDEAGAYEAQMTFLIRNGGSGEQISWIRIARDRVLATRQKAAEIAKKSPPA